MSQSSRHKALRPVREREQVARELAQLPWSSAVKVKPEHILRGISKFDVHAAAEHAVALVEQAAWDRAVGRVRPTPSDTASRLRLGRLILAAIEGQPRWCQTCEGLTWSYHPDLIEPPTKGPDEGQASVRLSGVHVVDSVALNGVVFRAHATTLTGTTASETNIHRLVCHTVTSLDLWRTGPPHRGGDLDITPQCPDCHGTGHNLRGTLPAVEWSAQVRRKVRDSGAQCGPGVDANPQRRDDDGMAAWVGGITDALDDIGMVAPDQPWYTLRRHCGTLDLRTRVEYRGEHRPWVVAVDASLDARITARGLRRGYMTNDAAGDVVGISRCPGWYRGELKHATQRRDRRARAAERRGHAAPRPSPPRWDGAR